MKDQKDKSPKSEAQSYLEKLEKATPSQASKSIIAKIMQAIISRKQSSDQ